MSTGEKAARTADMWGTCTLESTPGVSEVAQACDPSMQEAKLPASQKEEQPEPYRDKFPGQGGEV